MFKTVPVIFSRESIMEFECADVKKGWVWFFAAGAFGLFVSFGIFGVDRYLNESDYAERRYEKMHDMRVAQTSLETDAVDERLR